MLSIKPGRVLLNNKIKAMNYYKTPKLTPYLGRFTGWSKDRTQIKSVVTNMQNILLPKEKKIRIVIFLKLVPITILESI